MKVSKKVLQAALLGTTLLANSCQLIKTAQEAQQNGKNKLFKNEANKGNNTNPEYCCPACGMG